jgi:diguanylate cyclase (GGDEF)-like protein
MTNEPPLLARVVVVDDDRLILELVGDALRGSARVECLRSAQEALESLTREPADLVITDLTMPGMSGLELLERVRREHPGTDVALFTANASVESAVSALRLGAIDYLVKPIRPEELAMLVDRILAQRRILQENERLRDLLRTVESCRTLVRCLDPGEVYAVALDLLLRTLPRERGIALFRRTAVPMSDGIVFRGFTENQARALRTALVVDKPLDLESIVETGVVTGGALHEVLSEAGVEAGPALAIPVRGPESEAGVIWAFEDGKVFDRGETERARLVSGHAEIALGNAERYHHAKERAFIDDVTEVYNARFLLQATEREIQRAERYSKELCVLFLDLDRFKLVNDQYGHLVGSDVLRRLSKVLAECIRQVDTLARYGGDEFTILLVDTGLEEGMTIAERIRRTVAETIFEGGRGAAIRLSISIGVATYPQHAVTRQGLLDVADKAMYRAKSQGRNCVCSASELAS